MAERARQYPLLADEGLMSLVEAGDAQARRRRMQEKVEAQAATSQPSEAFSESWRHSQRELVRMAMNTLPPEQLKTLELAYFSGYTHMEIADILDVPLSTVKSRRRLGLKKIRAFFDSPDVAVPR